MIRLFGKAYYKKDVHGKLAVEFNVEDEALVRYNLDQLEKKTGGWAWVEIKPPSKPISRGPRSQMSRIHGHCSDIARQLNFKDGTSYTTEDVKEAMKRIAVAERYFPVTLTPDGLMAPTSLSKITAEDATSLIDTIMDFASAHELYLTEVDENGIPYKTLNGKRIEEDNQEGSDQES